MKTEITTTKMFRSGWIRSVRQSKELIFISATDGDEEFQLTVKDKSVINGELKIGASFTAEGTDSITPRGLYEFLVKTLTILGKSDDEFPIQPKEHSADFLRTIPHLRGRAATFKSIWTIRHKLSLYLQDFLVSKGFTQYWAPSITSADCEGAGETFTVKSDWLESHLTVSAQLHGEVGMMSLGKIYTFGPCYRAEKSASKKHLSEFWMLEPEMAFYDVNQTIDFVEEMLKDVLEQIVEQEDQFKVLRVDPTHITKILEKDWQRVTYDNVCLRYNLESGKDLGSEIEKRLVKDFKGPVFVTDWPKELKPFYMKKDGKVAKCFDLIFPEVGELVGGSQREEDLESLKKEMEEAGIDIKDMEWYLSTRKWGSVPHSGFGLGFERLLMFVCNLQKIQDAIPFPVHY